MKKNIQFYKFDGAGNDFVMIDNRDKHYNLEASTIEHICNRRLGVGADGLILLQSPKDATDGDFCMKYYNSDGNPAEMCGNGGRCIVAFAHLLGIGGKKTSFRADDGIHNAEIVMWNDDELYGLVKLGMNDVHVDGICRRLDGWLLNTGVPHYVQRVDNIELVDVDKLGRQLRHHPELGSQGANINFICDDPDGVLHVRTYERGVESETWSCGTGVTACSIISGNHRIRTRGGDFRVDFIPSSDRYHDVTLTGPAACNFKGEIILNI